MLLGNIAAIRTGVVATRKKATAKDLFFYEYNLLNLKCLDSDGFLNLQYVETLKTVDALKSEYFTQMDDILVRLSFPYTATMITNIKYCDFVVPSHFAIIRVNKNLAVPEYILSILKREDTRQSVLQNISGSTSFGTINSKFFSTLPVGDLTLDKQRIIGKIQLLSEKEQVLLKELTSQKEIYNKLLLDKIYDSIRKGN